MYRFWNAVIKPILEIVKPEIIVEIGSDDGKNTQNLLEFCEENNAVLHAIDPLPKFNVTAWEKKYGKRLIFHKSLSLDVIPELGPFDSILIDGDHNWYTVYNELMLIEKRCNDSMMPFPVTMVHDTAWPYGRRDLYYNPDIIPEAFRKPYSQKGIRPDSEELIEKGGLNAHLQNSIYEKGPQNGVLTAIEDFLKKTVHGLEMLSIPVLHGLAVLYPIELVHGNKDFSEFLRNLSLSAFTNDLLASVEKNRIDLVINYEEKLGSAEKNRIDLAKKYEEKLESAEKNRIDLAIKYEEKLESAEKNRIDLAIKYEEKIDTLNHNLDKASNANAVLAKSIDQLIDWIHHLDHSISAILGSRRWKFGSIIGGIHRIFFLKQKVPMAPEHVRKILHRFHSWESLYNEEKKTYSMTKKSHRVDSHTDEKIREQLYSTPPQYVVNKDIGLKINKIDIVVCVHNAQKDIAECLSSIIENTSVKYKLYIINDGSDNVTTEFLRKFSLNKDFCLLMENEKAQGYTKSANMGLRASTADYVILLNSDTVVPPYWVERLIECGESDPSIGIIGPLSNAASYQSIPEMRTDEGDWAVNPLPIGFTVNDMAKTVYRLSKKQFPHVPFINGFCYVIKRKVIDRIGCLDDKSFPNGYGEENDYSFRAAAAGFKLAIADHAYVYHKKSKSFSHETRRELSFVGRQALNDKHGLDKIALAIEEMEKLSVLDTLRYQIQQYMVMQEHTDNSLLFKTMKVLWLMIGKGGSGGAHSIIQESQGMRELGIHAEVAVHESTLDENLKMYPNLPSDFFYPFDRDWQLIEYASRFDIIVATHFSTIDLLQRIYRAFPKIIPAYYIQDYEPWIIPKTHPEYNELVKQAEESYTSIRGMVCFAKTQWLKDTIEKNHNVDVHRVIPSLDTEIYAPRIRTFKSRDYVHIVAMVRAITPRRAPKETMMLLKTIKDSYHDRVRITIFGSDANWNPFKRLPKNFEHENRGLLNREEVADLLSTADVFVDMSTYQAFGRTGLEAMAVGCAVILPEKGGVDEYAIHGENALIIDTESMEIAVSTLGRLIEDDELRSRLSENALLTASKYNIKAAALSEALVFQKAFEEKIVTIIVPVFNAYNETQACIERLLKYTEEPHQILLIDDYSPDESIWPMLKSYAKRYQHIISIRNERNLGYTSTINKGCQLAVGDVILLNSDTQVTPRWLLKLKSAAYRLKNVATVSPLSNAAGAFSVPINNRKNEIPEALNIDHMNALIEMLSPRLNPQVPTTNGFCMYITRKALNKVGRFDEENFPRGYGEENDFCMRASEMGFIHLIEDATYIYHKRSASFQESKQDIISKSQQKLKKLHPQYKILITDWLNNDPLNDFRKNLADAMKSFSSFKQEYRSSKSKHPVILYVLHNGAGGSVHTSLDLLSKMSEKCTCYLLRTDLNQWCLYKAEKDGLEENAVYSYKKEWRISDPLGRDRLKALDRVYATCQPDLVHIRHFIANHPDIISFFKSKNIPIIMSFHDFYTVCPTINLVDHTGRYCGGHCDISEGDCKSSHKWFKEIPPLKNRFVLPWRGTVGSVLSSCDAYVVTSKTTQRILKDHYPDLDNRKFHIIEHGRELEDFYFCSVPPPESGSMEVIFFGALGYGKGIDLVEFILKKNKAAKTPFHLHILGDASFSFKPEDYNCTYHGPYERKELPFKLSEIKPTVALIPSLWPETFCHCLTEAWAAGIPVIGSSLGAVGERIKRNGGGWILNPADPNLWYEKILYIYNAQDEYKKRVEEIKQMEFRNVSEMATDYFKLYNWTIGKNRFIGVIQSK